MRRPLKPFVTEYKGAARRQGSPVSQPLNIDAEPAAPRQPDPRPLEGSRLEGSRSVPPPQEDGYEAALRAADALFSPPQPSPVATRSVPAPRPADPWADAQPLDEAPTSTAPASTPNGGRILRVIDEPPSPELLRLEAERAPKRRGRKPGSKNKPKPAAVVETAILAAAALHEEPAPVGALAEDEAGAPERVTAPRPQLYRLPSARPASEPARDEKYAWVRTKLKPGERWKRRLPKVAW